ncbi:hypothetical protein NDU88_006788 [Pleurodeles waltl]|uniref:Uncharacterized protein n=1 Tax=Pleurodeles waltl TaxID=8319 RepID=A0AAV7RR54_PLEWA|nr:hypothetical protein NDU88_006788 [Pleurodeles waltl]
MCALREEIFSCGLLRGQSVRGSHPSRDPHWSCLESRDKREQGVHTHTLSLSSLFTATTLATGTYHRNLDKEKRLLR